MSKPCRGDLQTASGLVARTDGRDAQASHPRNDRWAWLEQMAELATLQLAHQRCIGYVGQREPAGQILARGQHVFEHVQMVGKLGHGALRP